MSTRVGLVLSIGAALVSASGAWAQAPDAIAAPAARAATTKPAAPVEAVASAQGGDVRTVLNEARAMQSDVVAALREALQGRRRAASASEILAALATIRAMQRAVIGSTDAMLGQTIGLAPEALSAEQREAIGRLADDQRAARERFTDWRTQFLREMQADDAPEALRAVREKVEGSPIAGLMSRAEASASANRLSEARASQTTAFEALGRLINALEVALSSTDELFDKRRQAIEQMIAAEQRIAASLPEPSGDTARWRTLRGEQMDVLAQAELLVQEESGLDATTRGHIATARDAMNESIKTMRKRDRDASRSAIEAAVAALQQAAVALEAAREEAERSVTAPQPNVERRVKPGGMPAMPGSGGGGLDVSPIAQIAADIAVISEVRRRQQVLYDETIGAAPKGPVPSGRQRSYAQKLPEIIERVQLYETEAAAALTTAHQAMLDSAGLLGRGDADASAPRQRAALDQLATAEERLQAFLKTLIETFSRIAKAAVEGSPHGAGKSTEERAKMTLLLEMLREIARIGDLLKQQDVVLAQTRILAAAPPEKVDAGEVAKAAKQQRELTDMCFDILKHLDRISEVAESLPEAVLEAGQWMEGAADALDVSNLNAAVERQTTAIAFLENAWKVVAQSMSTAGGAQKDRQRMEDTKQDKAGAAGDGTSAAQVGEPGADAWYWKLPDRARDAVSQSLAEPLPARYEAAIQAYYDRLSKPASSSEEP